MSLNTYARKVGIPCWNRTSLCGFANRRLSCSANGIEIESAGGSFHSRLRCYLVLASLNRSLFANKVRDHRRHRRVETNHVQHAAVVRVGEGEAVGGHGHNDCLRVTDELAAILTQRLRRVDVARPRFAVCASASRSRWGEATDEPAREDARPTKFGCTAAGFAVRNTAALRNLLAEKSDSALHRRNVRSGDSSS